MTLLKWKADLYHKSFLVPTASDSLTKKILKNREELVPMIFQLWFMKKLLLIPLALFLVFSITSCEYEDTPTSTTSSSKPSHCKNGYTGPQKDIQIDAFCMQAYSLICDDGKSKTSPEVKQVCELYKEMLDIAPAGYPSCPYCN